MDFNIESDFTVDKNDFVSDMNFSDTIDRTMINPVFVDKEEEKRLKEEF